MHLNATSLIRIMGVLENEYGTWKERRQRLLDSLSVEQINTLESFIDQFAGYDFQIARKAKFAPTEFSARKPNDSN